MMNFNLSVSLITVLLLILASIGCATAPVSENPAAKSVVDIPAVSSDAEKHAAETEKAAAKAAMDAAVFSGAEKYAAADINAAKKIWETAEARMKEEKFIEAKQNYVSAKSAFHRASAAVEEGKKVAAAEVNAAVANLEKAWENLKAAANNVRNRMKDKEMRADWEAFTKTFADDMKATKEKIVTDLAGAKENIYELMSIIERWDSTFKELSAAPVPHKATKRKAKPATTKK